MTSHLNERVDSALSLPVRPEIRAFAEQLARDADARTVLFYGSNLRTGDLEGVLDYYVLTARKPELLMWPRVSFHEWSSGDGILRAKVATMSMAKFRQAASGALHDTTIWARFVQPAALVWFEDADARAEVVEAVAAAAATASRVASVLGPADGPEETYWIALFEATYGAEFRIETSSRARSVFEMNREHFTGLLAPALEASGIACTFREGRVAPQISKERRRKVQRWWALRRMLGKPINLARLVRAAFTFEGAARYAAWKIERHSGVKVRLTPWRERHPLLAAPGVLWSVWKERRRVR